MVVAVALGDPDVPTFLNLRDVAAEFLIARILVDGCVASELIDAGLAEPRAFVDSAGDVLSARETARALLTGGLHASPDPTLAVLLLTATLLHVDSRSSGGGELRAILECLRRLGQAGPAAGFEASPMQFVRYVAAELQTIPLDRRTAVVTSVVGSLSNS